MRSSWKENDPGYTNRILAKVLVNGIPVWKCHTADEEQGIAICYATNPDGSVALNAKRDSTMDVIHYGVVKIVPRVCPKCRGFGRFYVMGFGYQPCDNIQCPHPANYNCQ